MTARAALRLAGLCLLFAARAVSAEEELHVTPSPAPAVQPFAAPERVITSAEIERSPWLTLDDILRSVPGFSLFRRSSSLAAHPTSQGASLRGIGPSGASRALVLLDGRPLGDPFGGWINWGKVPLEEIERIEVYRGGGSQIEGNGALGGVIKIISKPLQRTSAAVSAEGGNHNTRQLNAALLERRGSLGTGLSGRWFDTSGYPVIAEEDRGEIDMDAYSESGALRLRAEAGETTRLHIDGLVFREERGSGTALTGNETSAAMSSLAVERAAGDSYWRVNLFNHFQDFSSRFSSQSADRITEVPALDQFDVPSQTSRLAFDWQRESGAENMLQAGSFVSLTTGETRENFLYAENSFTRQRSAGGEEFLAGAYAAARERFSNRLYVSGALRLDYWRTAGGFSIVSDTESAAPLSSAQFEPHSRVILSPRLRAEYEIMPGFSLKSALYQSFRSPTLNELYRPFRVRNDITAANSALEPERLAGADFGVSFAGAGFAAEITAYLNLIRNLIANATLGRGPGEVELCGLVPADGICRQRRNIDEVLAAGIEADASYAFNPQWFAELHYALSDTEITESTADPELEGKELAQVPRHSLTAAINFDYPALLRLTLEGRLVSTQYEDDLNRLTLDRYFTLNAFVSHPLTDKLHLFTRIENLLDEEIEAAETTDGVSGVGAPRLFTIGLRGQL